jgi:hypothetical protein
VELEGAETVSEVRQSSGQEVEARGGGGGLVSVGGRDGSLQRVGACHGGGGGGGGGGRGGDGVDGGAVGAHET